MEEISRFFGSLFRSVIYRFKYIVMNAVEKKTRQAIEGQMKQLQQPKRHEQPENDRK